MTRLGTGALFDHSFVDGELCIRDIGRDAISVTNDAENVIAKLAATYPDRWPPKLVISVTEPEQQSAIYAELCKRWGVALPEPKSPAAPQPKRKAARDRMAVTANVLTELAEVSDPAKTEAVLETLRAKERELKAAAKKGPRKGRAA